MKLYAILLIFLVSGETKGTNTDAHCFEKSSDSEDCDNGCILGYHGNKCTQPCQKNCESYKSGEPVCSQDTGYCLNGCKTGWYGDQCNRKCPGNCALDVCDRSTGECLHCNEGFFGVTCQDKCPENCQGICTMDGSCECKAGFTGRTCEHECSNNCLNKQCHLKNTEEDIRVCSSGCKPGFTGLYCQELCPAECVTCNQSGFCESVNHGSRGKREDNSNCLGKRTKTGLCDCCRTGWTGQNCSEKCQKCAQRWDSITNTCIKACTNASYGESCDMPCSIYCTTGHCHKITGECNACKKNYYGDHCEKECDRRCNTSGCCQNTGHCKSCPPDRYGPYCQKKCSKGCIGGTCNHTTGSCECEDGWTGNRCFVKISRGCSSIDTVTIENGDHACIGPCKNGYCSNSCNAHCLKCASGCHKKNGTCLQEYKNDKPVHSEGVTACLVITSIFLVGIFIELGIILYLQHKMKIMFETKRCSKEDVPLTQSRPSYGN